MSFVKLETLPSNEPYRRALLPTFRFAIVFEVFQEEIVVVAVPHTSREPNYWLPRLGVVSTFALSPACCSSPIHDAG